MEKTRLLQLLVAAAAAGSACSWTGPSLKLVQTGPGGQFPALELRGPGAGDAPRLIPPFWMNLNNQGSPDVAAIVEQITRARDAGVPLLSVQLSDGQNVPPVSRGTKQILSLIRQHHPTASVIVRWYTSERATAAGPWAMGLQNISDPSDAATSYISSPTAEWVASTVANLSASLPALDAAFPGMIAGVQIEGGESGEWNLPPADPAGRMVGDYSAGMRAAFCAAEARPGVPSPVGGGGCALPTAAERDTATLGNAMLQWAGPANASARAFRYNRFVSQRTSAAVMALAAMVKNVTAGRSLTLSFGGYLFALSDTRLTGSGHLDLAALLTCPDLDLIASPYPYQARSREPAGRLTAHGPADSAALHGKAWAIEDDSRTALTDAGVWDRFVNDTAGTINLLRRNLYTAMLHRAAIYWLDLASRGWFGRADNASVAAITDAIWSNASHVLGQWRALLDAGSGGGGEASRLPALLPAAEVAVFVDEISAAARPLLGRGGTISSGYDQAICVVLVLHYHTRLLLLLRFPPTVGKSMARTVAVGAAPPGERVLPPTPAAPTQLRRAAHLPARVRKGARRARVCAAEQEPLEGACVWCAGVDTAS